MGVPHPSSDSIILSREITELGKTHTYRHTTKKRDGLIKAKGRARQVEGAKGFVPWLGSPHSSVPQCSVCGSSLTWPWAFYRDIIRWPSLVSHRPLVVSVTFSPSVLLRSIGGMLRVGNQLYPLFTLRRPPHPSGDLGFRSYGPGARF